MSRLLALDVGHGSDTYERISGKGVVYSGEIYEEHDFNSKLVQRVDKKIKQYGVETFLSQPLFSKEVPLVARTNQINYKKCCFSASFHANAGGGNGACIFYWPGSQSEVFAKIWVKHAKKNIKIGLHGDGLHAVEIGTWTNLHMVREVKAPAVLIEHGFMDSSDFEYIFGSKQSEHIEACAKTFVDAYAEFADLQKESGVSDWAQDAHEWVKETGISDGLRPKDNVTREELWTMLYRFKNKINF